MNAVKPGRLVLVLRGKYAGKKALIVSVHEKTKENPFPHVLLAGVRRSPKKVTRSMSQKKIKNRIKIKTFSKITNLNHVLLTRYMLRADLKPVINACACKDPAKRKVANKKIKTLFTDRHVNGKPSWLFKPLRF